MSMEYVPILFVAFAYVLCRLWIKASRQSAIEQKKREIVRETLRKRRIDHLYGRDHLDEDR